MSQDNPQAIINSSAINPSPIDSQAPTPTLPDNQPLTNIKYLKGFIEVISAAPTFIPTNFYDSIKIYNGSIYFFNYITNTWLTSGGSYLQDAGIGTTLPSASTYSGQYYYLTTTDTLYRSNGTAWIALN